MDKFGSDRVVPVMYAGLVCTVVVAVLPLFAGDVLGRHLRDVYTGYVDAANIGSTETVVLGYLVAIGVLGALAWLWSIRAVRRRGPRARAVVITAFAVATCLAVANLFVGEYGKPLVPALFGLLGLVPCAVGLAALVLLWRSPILSSPRG
ncbi:hypothetical protein [Amycolatopsis sp. CA-230715]|uniref:hypothetical protein n=1 Tax=Amycolatopsis sp. CA-230715 TaxID=2745196 RepID=UPI001C02308C|nr:hypothetical protein [Amycolatopsis sp. CA-230715]QWF79822.1 hypothetical protein HUW46_03235 [Amycolatopsis sp. CA-230715]